MPLSRNRGGLSVVHHVKGLGPNRSLFEISTIFEHERTVSVRASVLVDLAFDYGGANDNAVEVVVQSEDEDGSLVDRAVKGTTAVRWNEQEGVVGKLRQSLVVSAKVQPNISTRMLVRRGSGAVAGDSVSVTLRDMQYRGEECVPNNSGGCL